jgi:ATP-dependent helicase STH1/SNF2
MEVKRLSGPFIIIVPLSTMTNWEVEFSRWAPSVRLVAYKGSPAQRKGLANHLRPNHFNVCLTTYEYIIKDRPVLCKLKWAHMSAPSPSISILRFIQRAHSHRRGSTHEKHAEQALADHQPVLFVALSPHPNGHAITGAQICLLALQRAHLARQNNLPELWALLNFVLPKVFNSVKSFDEWFNTPFANTGGQEKIDLNEEESLLVIRRLHKVLRPFLLRRLKKDVEADLPDKVERIIKCKMSALQHRVRSPVFDSDSNSTCVCEQLYRQVKDFGVILAEDGTSNKGRTAQLNNQLMQLRKICNHPFVFRQVEDAIARHTNLPGEYHLVRCAGKFELLDRILPKLFAAHHRILMFFQMTHIMVRSLFLVLSLRLTPRRAGHRSGLPPHQGHLQHPPRWRGRSGDPRRPAQAVQRSAVGLQPLFALDPRRRSRSESADGRYCHHL